jgi:hypothetical protein
MSTVISIQFNVKRLFSASNRWSMGLSSSLIFCSLYIIYIYIFIIIIIIITNVIIDSRDTFVRE